ncbi:MAG: type III-B CRISPR module RAMP protein Cmr4 [Pirellulaceae bacterium]|nr:type III-B CRISPR module RAMP protein Cmr4 [Pirellulaceae bacterium]
MSEINKERQAAALLFLHAQTSLHPGSGTALGVVDLPVQRERHTQWPLIPGSALKGILRDRCREAAMDRYQDDVEEHGGLWRVIRSKRRVANEKDALLTAAFCPGKVDDQSAHAGAISLTDARIAAIPVRSLKGIFAWVTCPAVLSRLNRDLALAAMEEIPVPAIAESNQALCPIGSPLVLLPDKKIVLEEFELSVAGELPAALPHAQRANYPRASDDVGRLREG